MQHEPLPRRFGCLQPKLDSAYRRPRRPLSGRKKKRPITPTLFRPALLQVFGGVRPRACNSTSEYAVAALKGFPASDPAKGIKSQEATARLRSCVIQSASMLALQDPVSSSATHRKQAHPRSGSGGSCWCPLSPLSCLQSNAPRTANFAAPFLFLISRKCRLVGEDTVLHFPCNGRRRDSTDRVDVPPRRCSAS